MSYTVASLDTAFTEKQERDQSAMTIWGVFPNEKGAPRAMLMDHWADWLSFNNLKDRTIESCRKMRVDRLIIEAKANGISLAQEIRRLCGNEEFMVELVNPGQADKVARVHAVAGLFYAGIVHAPFIADDEGKPLKPTMKAQKVIDQCAVFPKGRYRDTVDTVSQALTHLRGRGMLRLQAELDADVRRETEQRGPDRPIYEV